MKTYQMFNLSSYKNSYPTFNKRSNIPKQKSSPKSENSKDSYRYLLLKNMAIIIQQIYIFKYILKILNCNTTKSSS